MALVLARAVLFGQDVTEAVATPRVSAAPGQGALAEGELHAVL